jgi:hypothetical protein
LVWAQRRARSDERRDKSGQTCCIYLFKIVWQFLSWSLTRQYLWIPPLEKGVKIPSSEKNRWRQTYSFGKRQF